MARTRNLLHFTKAKVSHTTMIAEPSNSKLGAVPVCVCPALYKRVSHDLTQIARELVFSGGEEACLRQTLYRGAGYHK